MPFEKSGSESAKKSNFDEFRHGPTFQHTERKFGHARAEKQMIAAVLSNQRRYGGGGRQTAPRKQKSRGASGRTASFTGRK